MIRSNLIYCIVLLALSQIPLFLQMPGLEMNKYHDGM